MKYKIIEIQCDNRILYNDFHTKWSCNENKIVTQHNVIQFIKEKCQLHHGKCHMEAEVTCLQEDFHYFSKECRCDFIFLKLTFKVDDKMGETNSNTIFAS